MSNDTETEKSDPQAARLLGWWELVWTLTLALVIAFVSRLGIGVHRAELVGFILASFVVLVFIGYIFSRTPFRKQPLPISRVRARYRNAVLIWSLMSLFGSCGNFSDRMQIDAADKQFATSMAEMRGVYDRIEDAEEARKAFSRIAEAQRQSINGGSPGERLIRSAVIQTAERFFRERTRFAEKFAAFSEQDFLGLDTMGIDARRAVIRLEIDKLAADLKKELAIDVRLREALRESFAETGVSKKTSLAFEERIMSQAAAMRANQTKSYKPLQDFFIELHALYALLEDERASWSYSDTEHSFDASDEVLDKIDAQFKRARESAMKLGEL
ncbi:MAG: hypothetical protein KDI66_19045 [Xanthomonadales bacterium]|nr:hypothetical protein [Xanthomonadales bacterium]